MATQRANNSSFARRKAFAIKHQEAEPLTRRDLQYDLLHHIFADQERVFTDPSSSSSSSSPSASSPTTREDGRGTAATFRDLYVHALMDSPRCSKALREKMQETPDFATDFAKMSLLANVGRVNTTMTFLPEMRTALRTYHPVPSLQKADANLQDAPRIKNILKACSLKDEATTNMPVTPSELRSRAASGVVPSTSIVNLLFVLSNHFTTVAHDHFGRLDIDFLDLFLPTKLSSPSRAQVFLWLVFHYHETPSSNPFDDEHAKNHLGLIPELTPLSEEEFEKENVDPEDERNYATKMTKLRMEFLAKNAQGNEANSAKDNKKGMPKSKLRPPSSGKSIPTKRERSDPDSATEEGNAEETDHGAGPPSHRRRHNLPKSLELSRTLSDSSTSRASNRQSSGSHRSILQQAWHVVTTVDAFYDSDDEDIDESARHAYAMRLQVLADFHQNITTPHLPTSVTSNEHHLISSSHA